MVETLVAFAVLALVLIILLGALSRMASGGHQAEVLREALQLAQAKLDGLGIVEPLAPGDSTGSFQNGLEWRLQVHDTLGDRGVQITGAWVEVTVSQVAVAARVPLAVSLVTFKLEHRASETH